MRDDPLFKIVPGYKEAVERETAIREIAFLPLTETLCGFECLPFTPLHFSMLEVCRSPFVSGGTPMPEDIAAFLWCISADYSATAKVRRWRFMRKARSLDYRSSVEAIFDYIQDAFSDAPGAKRNNAQSYYSGTASIVDIFASQYGWSEADILRMPFKRVWQYARCIRERQSDKPIFFNGSERILADWQEAEETKRREAVASN